MCASCAPVSGAKEDTSKNPSVGADGFEKRELDNSLYFKNSRDVLIAVSRLHQLKDDVDWIIEWARCDLPTPIMFRTGKDFGKRTEAHGQSPLLYLINVSPKFSADILV